MRLIFLILCLLSCGGAAEGGAPAPDAPAKVADAPTAEAEAAAISAAKALLAALQADDVDAIVTMMSRGMKAESPSEEATRTGIAKIKKQYLRDGRRPTDFAVGPQSTSQRIEVHINFGSGKKSPAFVLEAGVWKVAEF